jgi:GMP synthase-like glutamine amidotransferase
VGWIDVESSLEAVRGRWFQWHQDVFTVPDGAEVLATSPAGPQVFRRGSGVAVQFHPEVDSHHMRLWMASGGASEIANHGLDPEALVAETAALDDAMRPRIENLVDWFLDNAG